MLALGKSFLLLNRYDPLERIISRNQGNDTATIQEIANDIFSWGET